MKFLPTAYFSQKYVKYLAMNIDTAKTKAMHSKYYEFSEQQFHFFNGTIKIINDIKVLKILAACD